MPDASLPAAFPTLRTADLTLREIVPDDAPALLAVHGDAQAMRWYGVDPLPDLAAAQALVQTFAQWRTQPNPGTRWALQPHGHDTLVGSCGLFAWNRGWRKCSLGYELAPAWQGRGLMRQALQAVLAWGFEAMELNRVEALIHPDNASSIRLAGALGFTLEGRLRHLGRWGGRQHDMLMYALLRDDPRP